MSANAVETVSFRSWFRNKMFLGMSIPEYLKSLITPFNIIAAMILAVGIPVAVIRFTQGLQASTHLTNDYPWGLWIGFDVLCGVALAAGGFTLGSAVYLFGMKEYRPIVRPAILTGFLGYFFVVIGLCFDLGRPWRLPYPMLVSYGVTSVMFLVGWHVALYLSCQFVEFCPAIFEWLGWKKWRKFVVSLTIGATIFGVILSTLHQSALGGLFLLAPGKLHPLWYTPFLPVFFFVSAVIGGISMVIFESMMSHRLFHHQIDPDFSAKFDRLTIGLGKAASALLFTYFCMKWIGVAHGNHWDLLGTNYGHWFLLEVIGFVLMPAIVFGIGVRNQSAKLIRFTAVWTILGLILNRVNVSMIAFNWQLPNRYIPSWMEFTVTITIVTAGLLTFRWIVNRMPVLYDHPDFEPH
jgi:Ni/Fe-hydrogenase subunit HybB-like protein